MLRALNEYYDCLCRQDKSLLTPRGYSKVAINYNMILSSDGKLKEILPYTNTVLIGKKSKEVPRDEIFPLRNSASAISAELIDHREKYIFGLEWSKEGACFVSTKNSVLAFKKNKEKSLEFLEDIDTPLVKVYELFLESWNPEEEKENSLLQKLGKDYSGAKFVVSLEYENELLHSIEEVKKKWDEKLVSKEIPKDAVMGQCAISGEYAPIARIHNNLKGIQGGLATGTNIVCYKTTAFCSYNKSESYNSSISQEAMEKYVEAFNYLSTSQEHKQVMDNTTFLFWAMTDKEEQPFIQSFSSIMGFGFMNKEENQSEAEEISRSIGSIMDNLSKGLKADFEQLHLDESTQFYILGIKPNTSRLSIKFFERNSFGELMVNIMQHQIDMRFNSSDKQIAMWQMLQELKSPIGNNELPPDLNSKLLESILNNRRYPKYLLDTLVYRVKTDQDSERFNSINSTRVRMIKAYLTRANYIEREKYSMLNKENKESAYNCGRLFAVLEAVQCKALPGINATIRDRFFASACSTPYLVFPRLMKLTQNHLGKIEGGLKVYYDSLIADITGNLEDSFPKAFNMEKQGMFILGYYQQKEDLYTKKECSSEIA